jgi:ribA/ribD-fused uncharacterized protein
MEAIVTPQVVKGLHEFISLSKKDPKIELECKLLAGKIQTKDVADRIMMAIKTLSVGTQIDSHYMTFSYTDDTRVTVDGGPNILKLILTGSFKEIPLTVEKKLKRFDGLPNSKTIIEEPEASAKFTIRSETLIRKDWDANANDPRAHVRLIHRASFKTPDELFRIDFSQVKTRQINSKKTLRDMTKDQPTYELEIEFIGKKSTSDEKVIAESLFKVMNVLLQAYYESPYLLPVSDIQRYQEEFKRAGHIFFSPVTMRRRHIDTEMPHNISKGYTVTNKADGQRAGLYVARDRRLIKVTKSSITWTGLTASDDTHIGDFVDGEYIPGLQLFAIFDVYRFRNRDTRNLPLLTTDEDMLKNPLKCRLGCIRLFVEDLKSKFVLSPSSTPIRIETKLFLAGDGAAMEDAIKTILSTKFEYETDGLIFTPRSSTVAPVEDRDKQTWLRVYKWKPAEQNTIDFLLRILPDETLDPITGDKVKKGELYVSKTAGRDVVYPRETMTGEYVPRKLPEDLQKLAEVNTRVPAVFQPSSPRDPDAYKIMVPMNEKNVTEDIQKNRVEDNTIVECAFDTETRRWSILRTRYDKTYQYRVLREPNYGNDIKVADDIWSSMHIPVTEQMIKTFITDPNPQIYDDDAYYRDDVKRSNRVLGPSYDFHNMIKDDLFKANVKKGDTLLELASGQGGDMLKWKRVQPSKVVGVDYSLSNITSPIKGAAMRYIKDKQENPRDYRPSVLYVQGDMTAYPLFNQEDKYMKILTGEEKATTSYLSQFEGLDSFDTVSCQFALHYACESEESFRNFAKNIQKYGKGIFFGTCSDGKSIYSLLVGKKTHIFGSNNQVAGEYMKEYMDKDSWTEEFGMPIRVFLESFDKPAVEYLVPFAKVTQIMSEYGFELVESKLFSEIYSNQSKTVLTADQQTFSFLNRTFVFKYTGKKAKQEEEVKVEKDEENVEGKPLDLEETDEEKKTEQNEVKKDDEKKVVETEKEGEKKDEEPKKKKRLKKAGGEPEPEPILFFGADESKGEYRAFSNMSNHPIEMDGQKYHTVEHYFQAMKAKEFGDDDSYNRIVKAKTPKAAKAIGQKVKDYVEEKWVALRDDIMEKAVHAKFIQHPELRKQLLETGDKVIGEANPRDTYWGIGTSMDLERSKKPSKWRGQNKLGKLLMKLRDDFKKEMSA